MKRKKKKETGQVTSKEIILASLLIVANLWLMEAGKYMFVVLNNADFLFKTCLVVTIVYGFLGLWVLYGMTGQG